MRIGAVEGGGTKMVLGVFSEDGTLQNSVSLQTEAPEATIPKIARYFEENPVDALGVASFGPVDLRQGSETYGYITSTPKLPWRNYPFLPTLRAALRVPCGLDTDVNAAALAESRLGAGRGLQSLVYVTVGTGVGGGVIVDGRCVHGLVHPEIGHMLLRPLPGDPLPKGACPYHDGCLEGLASGSALAARCGGHPEVLPDDDPMILRESGYLAQMCVNLIVTLSPEKIILGGGVMQRKALLPLVRAETGRLLGGYVQSPAILEHMDEYIVSPALFPVSGLYGAYLLGRAAASPR